MIDDIDPTRLYIVHVLQGVLAGQCLPGDNLYHRQRLLQWNRTPMHVLLWRQGTHRRPSGGQTRRWFIGIQTDRIASEQVEWKQTRRLGFWRRERFAGDGRGSCLRHVTFPMCPRRRRVRDGRRGPSLRCVAASGQLAGGRGVQPGLSTSYIVVRNIGARFVLVTIFGIKKRIPHESHNIQQAELSTLPHSELPVNKHTQSTRYANITNNRNGKFVRWKNHFNQLFI